MPKHSFGFSMTAMKERISNVIAWVGFVSLLVVVCSASVHFWYQSIEKPKRVLLETCEEFDTPEYWNENTLFAAVVKKYSSDKQLELCKLKSNWVSMWYYKSDVVVLTGRQSSIRWLWDVDHKIDGFTYIDTEEIFEFFIPIALPLWLISIVLNYILVGSARLLPWRKAVINEEAS